MVLKKFIAQGLLAFPVWMMMGSISFAMCIWFAPPARQFAPADNMKTLISQEDGTVTMTVQPQFSGTATDFALVMPFPSEPTVEEAPEAIFTELEDLTNPFIDFNDGIALTAEAADASLTREEGVRVIEERDVGDFSTVTLSATSESALVTWLENEGYEITDEKKAILAEYVNSDGYFVALKVNMSEAEVDTDGRLEGELRPISFVFDADTVSLPLRLMSGDGAVVTLTVYTIADQLTYVPGAEIQFSKKVEAGHIDDAPSLSDYDPQRKWLVRNSFQVDTEKIENDLQLLTTIEERVVVPEEVPIVLNPDLLPSGTGVLGSDRGVTIYTDETPEETSARTSNASSSLTTAMVILLGISNVILLTIIVANHGAAKSTQKK